MTELGERLLPSLEVARKKIYRFKNWLVKPHVNQTATSKLSLSQHLNVSCNGHKIFFEAQV